MNQERGYCIQLSGHRTLLVHRLEKFENSPKIGEALKIFYAVGAEKAKIQKYEDRKLLRRIR